MKESEHDDNHTKHKLSDEAMEKLYSLFAEIYKTIDQGNVFGDGIKALIPIRASHVSCDRNKCRGARMVFAVDRAILRAVGYASASIGMVSNLESLIVGIKTVSRDELKDSADMLRMAATLIEDDVLSLVAHAETAVAVMDAREREQEQEQERDRRRVETEAWIAEADNKEESDER